MQSSVLGAGRRFLLRICRQSWNSTVRRVDDQRRSQRRHDAGPAAIPDLVIGATDISFSASVPAVRVRPFPDLLLILSRFFFGEELLFTQFGRSRGVIVA